MSRVSRLTCLAVLVGALPILATCSSPPQSSGPGVAAAPLTTNPGICRVTRPDGGNCVTMQQQPCVRHRPTRATRPGDLDLAQSVRLRQMQISSGWTTGTQVGGAR